MLIYATMKTIKRWLTLSVFGMALGLALSQDASASERLKVVVGVEGAFPPFNFIDANNKLQGFDVDIANALCESGNLDCSFVLEKWDNMIPSLLAHKYDVVISSMSMSVDRRKIVDFSNRYYNSPSIFIAPKASPLTGVTQAELKGLKIGVSSSTAQENYVKNLYPESTMVAFSSSPELYKGLEHGSVDIILEDKLAIYDWISNTKAGSCCHFVGPDLTDQTYFGEGSGMAVRLGEDQLRSRLNEALAKIKEEGTYDAINAKYFPFSIE
jgi:polar amino acid transport system substrate-binding protein